MTTLLKRRTIDSLNSLSKCRTAHVVAECRAWKHLEGNYSWPPGQRLDDLGVHSLDVDFHVVREGPEVISMLVDRPVEGNRINLNRPFPLPVGRTVLLALRERGQAMSLATTWKVSIRLSVPAQIPDPDRRSLSSSRTCCSARPGSRDSVHRPLRVPPGPGRPGCECPG